MKERKKMVAKGVLTTAELMHFFDTVSMLKISAENRLKVDVSDHKVPNNTWLVSLWANDMDRETLIDSLKNGHLAHKWAGEFRIETFYDENNLPPIPDGYELIESYDHLKQTDMFLHEGQWLLSTEPILEVDAIVAGKSVYHGNIPVIRKK